jgi:hypothetical protein
MSLDATPVLSNQSINRPAGARARRLERRLSHQRRALFDLVIATAVLLLFSWPMLATTWGFNYDFTNSMWLGWLQSQAIAHAHTPTYFLNASGWGLFSPSFLFLGTAPFVISGGISALVGGHFVVVFVAVTIGAAAMAYGGSLWLARLGGVRTLLAHAVPIAVVTAAYYATDLYGRGAWPEWIGFSSLPLFLASAISIYRSSRLRLGPVAALVLSTVLLTGSHNVVLLFSTIFGTGIAIVAVVLFGWRRIAPRRVLVTGAIVALGGALNAWFLLADVAFGPSTGETLEGTSVPYYFFDSARTLFDPLRFVPDQSGTLNLYVQVPIWLFGWSLICGGLLAWSQHSGRSSGFRARTWLLVTGAALAVLGLVMATFAWPHLPRIIQDIQFPYRLNGFVAMFAGFSLIPVLAAVEARHASAKRHLSQRLALGSLALAAAMSLGLCWWQVNERAGIMPYPSYANRGDALASVTQPPFTWYESPIVYADAKQPAIDVPADRFVDLPPIDISSDGNSYVEVLVVPDGPAPIAFNFSAGPNILTVGGGFERIGRTSAGFVVVRRIGDLNGPAALSLSLASNIELTGGKDISAIAIVATLVLLAMLALPGSLRRRLRGALKRLTRRVRRNGPVDQRPVGVS